MKSEVYFTWSPFMKNCYSVYNLPISYKRTSTKTCYNTWYSHQSTLMFMFLKL